MKAFRSARDVKQWQIDFLPFFIPIRIIAVHYFSLTTYHLSYCYCLNVIMRRVAIRRNSLSIIISGCNSSRGASHSAAISISTRSYHNDANRRSWQQQQQQRWSSCCWYKPTSIQSPQIPIQRVHHFSSLNNDGTNKCEDDNKQEEIKLVSIHDHLDELHDIPLADVRNFCIIAHVVSKLVYACE